jgi:hypothetical protein
VSSACLPGFVVELCHWPHWATTTMTLLSSVLDVSIVVSLHFPLRRKRKKNAPNTTAQLSDSYLSGRSRDITRAGTLVRRTIASTTTHRNRNIIIFSAPVFTSVGTLLQETIRHNHPPVYNGEKLEEWSKKKKDGKGISDEDFEATFHELTSGSARLYPPRPSLPNLSRIQYAW